MQRDEVLQLVEATIAVDATTAAREQVTDAIVTATRVKAWLDSRLVDFAHALERMGAAAEDVMASASRSDSRDAERVVKRAATARKAPLFGKALADGKVASGHLDQLGNSLRRLDTDQQRSALLADEQRLAIIAANSTPDEFAKTLRAEERRLSADDGMSRLERQRSSVRLNRRTDLETGMNIFTLSLDPVTG